MFLPKLAPKEYVNRVNKGLEKCGFGTIPNLPKGEKVFERILVASKPLGSVVKRRDVVLGAVVSFLAAFVLSCGSGVILSIMWVIFAGLGIKIVYTGLKGDEFGYIVELDIDKNRAGWITINYAKADKAGPIPLPFDSFSSSHTPKIHSLLNRLERNLVNG